MLIHSINRKDFHILYGPEEVSISVFQLLATACKEMVNLSAQLKRTHQRQADSHLKRFIYSRILWSKHHVTVL